MWISSRNGESVCSCCAVSGQVLALWDLSVAPPELMTGFAAALRPKPSVGRTATSSRDLLLMSRSYQLYFVLNAAFITYNPPVLGL